MSEKLCDSCRKLLTSEGGGTFYQLLIGVRYSSQLRLLLHIVTAESSEL